MKITRLSMRNKQKLEGFAFISPWLIGTILFFIVPLYQSVYLSFSKLDKISQFKMHLTGFENYARALLWDISFIPMFLNAISQTLINTPLIVIFSLFISILLNRNIRLRGFFRGVYILPVVLGTGFVMQQLLGVQTNGAPEGMAAAGIQTGISRGIAIPVETLQYLGPVVLGTTKLFLARITIILWKSGVQIVLFLGGIQSIPKSLYESAYCDGATEWEMFWKISLPMLSPVILLNIVYTIVDSFTDSSNPIVQTVLDLGFKRLQFEYAAAISWIYLSFIFLLIGVIFAIFKISEKSIEKQKKEEYNV